MASRGESAQRQKTWFTDTRLAEDAGNASTAAFVAGQVAIAFALMLLVNLADAGLYVQGAAFLEQDAER
jgi:hypothetical protein